MTSQTEGYFTRGMTIVDGASLSSSSTIPVDTALSNGQSPQSAAIVPGTEVANANFIALTALAGGGKTGATQLSIGANKVTTCATNNDSALLPYAYPGAKVYVYNAGAATLAVFGKGTDIVNAVATVTANTLATGVSATYVGVDGAGDGSNAGHWMRIMSA